MAYICFVCLLAIIINENIIKHVVNCNVLLNVPNNGFNFVLLMMVHNS